MERFETEKTKMAALQDANETMKSKIDRYIVCQLVSLKLYGEQKQK